MKPWDIAAGSLMIREAGGEEASEQDPKQGPKQADGRAEEKVARTADKPGPRPVGSTRPRGRAPRAPAG